MMHGQQNFKFESMVKSVSSAVGLHIVDGTGMTMDRRCCLNYERKAKVLAAKPVPSPLCPLQIPNGMKSNWTSAAKSRLYNKKKKSIMVP
jgi:hypothetical protein